MPSNMFTHYMAQYQRAADNAAFYSLWANRHRTAGRLRHSIAYQDMAAIAARDAAHAAGMIMYLTERHTSSYRQMKGLTKPHDDNCGVFTNKDALCTCYHER